MPAKTGSSAATWLKEPLTMLMTPSVAMRVASTMSMPASLCGVTSTVTLPPEASGSVFSKKSFCTCFQALTLLGAAIAVILSSGSSAETGPTPAIAIAEAAASMAAGFRILSMNMSDPPHVRMKL
jgi:hypothetical protein